MAWNSRDKAVSRKAIYDLSSQQNMIVDLATTEVLAVTAPAAGRGVGVLQNNPRSGEFATVITEGEARVRAGATVTIGAFVTAAASGTGGPCWATPVTSGMTGPVYALGQALTDAASGSYFTVDLDRRQVFTSNSAGLVRL
jgi:hypothetical protein